MNKTYLRYELSETFGVVASPQSNAIFDSTGDLGISAALHEVAVWNLRQCSLVRGANQTDRWTNRRTRDRARDPRRGESITGRSISLLESLVFTVGYLPVLSCPTLCLVA